MTRLINAGKYNKKIEIISIEQVVDSAQLMQK